jgi:hypothetical protein
VRVLAFPSCLPFSSFVRVYVFVFPLLYMYVSNVRALCELY